MKLEFSGSPEIAAPRERVWQRLMDPHFVAKSAPGVESVVVIDPTHFKVISGFGVGSIKVRPRWGQAARESSWRRVGLDHNS